MPHIASKYLFTHSENMKQRITFAFGGIFMKYNLDF